MTSEYNIENFLKMYYIDSNIPMYLYEEGKCTSYAPEQTSLTFPAQKYIDMLDSKKETISYFTTKEGISYGYVYCKEMTHKYTYIILGPISSVPYSQSALSEMHRDYVIPNDSKDEFKRFLMKISHISKLSFVRKLIFINFCLNKEIIPLEYFYPNINESEQLPLKLKESRYDKKENFMYNRSYDLEETILNIVRQGDLEGLKSLQLNAEGFNTGINGDDAVQQLKNNILISTTLYTRAAISGGLDYDTAYELSDYFIHATEQTNDCDILQELLYKTCYTFTEKVAESQVPVTSDARIQKAVQFIIQNTNQRITVGDVADYVGFSKSYLSAYFKDTLGFKISDFILRCKLEEGRDLLRFTDKSITTISTYLCFSSQSHFQTAFKKQYGITPKEYRRQNS